MTGSAIRMTGMCCLLLLVYGSHICLMAHLLCAGDGRWCVSLSVACDTCGHAPCLTRLAGRPVRCGACQWVSPGSKCNSHFNEHCFSDPNNQPEEYPESPPNRIRNRATKRHIHREFYRHPNAHFHRHTNQHPIKHVNHQTTAHCFCHSDALCNACPKSMQSPSPTSRAYQWVRRKLPPSDTLSATRRCQGLLRHWERFGGVGVLGHGPSGYCACIF